MRMLCPILLVMSAMAAESTRIPVLVELFTSEGCSSCPPADRLLSHLLETQPIPGVEIIPLSEHVDYWNQLGWTDPFSSSAFSERQRQYAATLRGEGVYTPQMVVDGKAAFVGSDTQRALQAITDSAKSPKAAVAVHCSTNPPSLAVRIESVTSDADVTLAITENALQSNVTRGENKGRVMAHAGVTRSIAIVGRARKRQPFTVEPKLLLDKTWNRDNLSAVVFLQDRASRRVLGAARIPISACVAN